MEAKLTYEIDGVEKTIDLQDVNIFSSLKTHRIDMGSWSERTPIGKPLIAIISGAPPEILKVIHETIKQFYD